MNAPKMPKAWIQAGTKKVEARIDMSAEVAGKGLCPECRNPMTASVVNGHDALTCDADRIVLPVPDAAE